MADTIFLTHEERGELDRRLRSELNVGAKTGYYGRPGDGYEGRRKVHVFKAGVPMCRAPIHPEAFFVWNANGVVKDFVDCGNCRRWIKKWERRLVDDFIAQLQVKKRGRRR